MRHPCLPVSSSHPAASVGRHASSSLRRWFGATLTAGTLALSGGLHAQSMTVQSLDGPVTANEISSYKAYILTLNPVVYPDTGSIENQYAQAVSGEQIKAMGLMYEITGDRAILDRMIYFCDALLTQRNDLLGTPYGQKTYATGSIEPAWTGQRDDTTPYSTAASGDCVGHLAYCARLILQSPSILSLTVPDGNPNGFGATYGTRAATYIADADYTVDQYFLQNMLDLSNSNRLYYSASSPYQTGQNLPWNQQMMMNYGFYNLAWAHSILGDSPTRVAQYDGIVQASVNWFFNTAATHTSYTDGAGRTAWDWGYAPSAASGEDNNHGSLDVAGFYRLYLSGRYGITAAQMQPIANAICDVLTRTVGSDYAGRINGTDGTGHAAPTTYLRSGYFFMAEFRSDQYYNMVTGIRLSAGGTTTSSDAFSRLMWMKNRRYVGTADFTLATTPSSQTVTAGGSANYTATITANNGFTGAVSLSVTGLPAGATAAFSPSSVSTSGTSTLSVTTTAAAAAGTYTLAITGASGSLTHTSAVTLVVTGTTTLPAGWSNADIGSPALAGSTTYSGGTFTLKGCGSDIYTTADQFQYAYTSATGDVTLTARVASQQNTNGWAKSGVMLRASTAAGSVYVGIYITPTNGVDMQYRSTTGGSAADLARLASVAAPYWLRLVRAGSTFTGYASADGSTWTQVGSVSVTMASGILAGLADCSHSTSALCTTTFDNVTLTTPVAQVAAPTFSPAGGSYTSTQTVTLSTTTAGAAIRYTLDGSTPTASTGTVYSSALTISATTTVKAIASLSGMTDSAVRTATYTIGANDTNIAPSGTAYAWTAMSTATANAVKTPKTGLNDNNLTTDVDLAPSGEAANIWEGAGVTWSTAKSISSVKFINGTITSGGDGFLTANCKLQFSTDGSTWMDSGWTISPTYPYSSSAGGLTYTFTGTGVTGKLGARVVGQVRTTDTSYHWIVKEVQVIGQ